MHCTVYMKVGTGPATMSQCLCTEDDLLPGAVVEVLLPWFNSGRPVKVIVDEVRDTPVGKLFFVGML